LEKLKKFTKLRKIVFTHNYLNSFILLSKIECINSLQSLVINDNEVLLAKTLKSFIVYRFQHITEFNGLQINDLDKKIAKQEFQLFDKILSIQNIFTKKVAPPSTPNVDPTQKRQEQRLRSKKNLEFAHVYVVGMLDEGTRREAEKHEVEIQLERAVKAIIAATTEELLGGHQDPEEVLERFI
jgi:hypothetical protein